MKKKQTGNFEKKNVWRQTKSAPRDDSDEDCAHLISKGAVTTGHDKCRFVDSHR